MVYEFQTALLKHSERGKYPHLKKWREYIEKLCKERNEEVFIWFDTSAPFDEEINVRLKSHRCHYSCVSLRFREGILQAYDSHFGGGTSFCHFNHTDFIQNPNVEKDKVDEIMNKVFNKECANSSWEDGDMEKFIPELDENEWEIKKW